MMKSNSEKEDLEKELFKAFQTAKTKILLSSGEEKNGKFTKI